MNYIFIEGDYMPIEVIRANEYLQNPDDIIINKRIVEGQDFTHAHEFIEIAYVAAGKGTHTLDGEEDIISKGDLFLISTNVLHEFTAFENSPLTIYNCIFQPPAIDNSLEGCKDFVDVAFNYLFHSINEPNAPKKYLKLVGVHSNTICDLFESMYFESKNRDKGFKQILKSKLICLLVYTFRIFIDNSNNAYNNLIYKSLIIENTILFIKEHYSENLKIKNVAQRAYISETYFSKIFKEQTGKTFVEYLQDIRINAACALLVNTRLTISDIADECGYSDIKYFYKIFFRIKKLTPGEFRKRSK